MAYKLIAVDVDGTLLDSNSSLSDETREAVKKAVEKGVIFTISTGRPIQGVRPLMKQMDLEEYDFPVITYNGAMALTYKTGEIIYSQNLSKEDARQIIELGRKLKTDVMVWANNNLYTLELNQKALDYSSISKVTPYEIDDLDKVLDLGVTKVLWYDEVETIARYEREIGSELGDNVNFHSSRPYFLEFVDKRASKAIAMEKIGQKYNISREEMIAVGDGFNDISMIEYAGMGVAMGNAAPEVKEKAKFVTLSNDEHGVAHVIYTFIK